MIDGHDGAASSNRGSNGACFRPLRGLVTVSDPLAEVLRAKYGLPTEVVLNGFDAEDFSSANASTSCPEQLRIVYTGMIYEGRRDPAPLFEAIRRLGPAGANVRVEFYGRYLDVARQLAARYDIGDRVEIRGNVPYRESLTIQQSADILLLLLWDDPRERGVYTGKLFEYLGSRRPILTLGAKDNVAAALVARRGAGYVSNDPSAIARRLETWLEEKRERGGVAAPPSEARFGLSREDQTRRLERFLLDTPGTNRNAIGSNVPTAGISSLFLASIESRLNRSSRVASCARATHAATRPMPCFASDRKRYWT